MKTIGLLGGMSWESTVVYYQILNREALRRHGGVSSAKILLNSVDFADYDSLLKQERWDEIAARLSVAGRNLVVAGADLLAICTNTMHKVAGQVAHVAGVPLVHIGEATAARLHAAGMSKVALLGTIYTMEMGFYRDLLADAGLEVVLPAAEERIRLNAIIFEELVRGDIRPASRQICRNMILRLVEQGVEGVVLGCTELPLLIMPEDAPVPLFDTVEIHAMAIADLAFS